MRKPHIFSLGELGLEVEFGKVATQADGSVLLKKGGTVMLATVVEAKTEEFPGFLPLTVDYREHFAAAGKIPGGYFKREGRPTDTEVLTSRLIDRAIRPLFPERYFNKLQVMVTVYSVDKAHTPNVLALLGASLALNVSKIPFLGPVGIAEVGRVDGSLVFEPSYDQMQESDLRVVVAGTAEGICMVEGSANEISEQDLIDILFKAHERIARQVAWQLDIQKQLGVEKNEVAGAQDWQTVAQKVEEYLTTERVRGIVGLIKADRKAYLSDLKEQFLEQHGQAAVEGGMADVLVGYVYEDVLKKKLTTQMFELNKRIDGREFETVREISSEVGLLPFTHGSALFTRGQTQALVTVTLGGGQDEQRIEDLMGDRVDQSFMLHYNFPPYSVGEVRPLRGPGRREVGHGYLAASGLQYVLPSKEDFPYTIRVVADMLESDGSTSMATVCGSTMALMDAGVPIRKMVSGIAMGLIRSADNTFQALTDITGAEDAFGLMDFKVIGTDEGITAIQMDIKHKGGLPREVFEKALAQSNRGRSHIMQEMRKVMTEPRASLSDLVPKIVSFAIPREKIGAIIGKGGETIRAITDTTSVTIDIEDEGRVNIFGHPGPKMEQAINWVKILAGQIEVGRVYDVKVQRIVEFGVFVELAPGQVGLIHISLIPRSQQQELEQHYPIGSPMRALVTDHDTMSGRIRLKPVQ